MFAWVRGSFMKNILHISFACRILKRNLNVHEHIAYSLLNEYKIPTPRFKIAKTPDECEKFATELCSKDLILKAQVLTGGRGVGKFKNGLRGGVKVISSPEDAKEIGSKMLQQILVTRQTGPKGLICNKVMVAERKFPRREFYFAIMMERAFNGPVLIASSHGGVSIEDVAEDNPEAIIYEPIHIKCGLSKEQALTIAHSVGLCDVADQTADMLLNMYELFCKNDAVLVEINPYAQDAIEDCAYYALDAKIGFDDNAEFRQKEIHSQRDLTQEDPLEVAAHKVDMNYVSLDGNIGCMVNGAGLAMATMDIIKLSGGEPANFLDVGGTGSVETIKEAFRIITLNKNVNTIFVNIFAGINRCDVIAEAVITAVKNFKMDIPIVIRLQGTNAEKGKDLIQKSSLPLISQNDLSKAARTAVVLSQILSLAETENVKVTVKMFESGKDNESKRQAKKCTRKCK